VESSAAQAPGVWPWERLRSRCLREAIRILRRREDAEEAAQEALLRAWRRRNQCQDLADPEPWVAQIARHEALRVLHRRRLAEARRAGQEVMSAVEDHRMGPQQTLDALYLADALSALPPADRALATLHYSGDIAQGKLAEAMGMPEPTVRVRLHRLRRRLKEQMTEG
jgi:RNA polymerase sigma-70 factor (ECF subfamily)